MVPLDAGSASGANRALGGTTHGVGSTLIVALGLGFSLATACSEDDAVGTASATSLDGGSGGKALGAAADDSVAAPLSSAATGSTGNSSKSAGNVDAAPPTGSDDRTTATHPSCAVAFEKDPRDEPHRERDHSDPQLDRRWRKGRLTAPRLKAPQHSATSAQ